MSEYERMLDSMHQKEIKNKQALMRIVSREGIVLPGVDPSASGYYVQYVCSGRWYTQGPFDHYDEASGRTLVLWKAAAAMYAEDEFSLAGGIVIDWTNATLPVQEEFIRLAAICLDVAQESNT